MPAAASFDLVIRSAEDGSSRLLGLWSSSVDDPLAYAAAAEPTLWRVHLPTDPALATRLLTTAGEHLAASMRRLPVAKDKLAAALDPGPHWAFGGQGSGAEGALSAWLDGDHVSYATGAASRRVTPAMLSDCAAFVDRLCSACAPVAVIETLSGDRLVCRSRLALDGNAATVVRSDRGMSDTRLHEQAVVLAASSRVALLRVLGLAARAAVAISVRLVLPGGPLLALGPALRFVHEVVAGR